MNKQETLVVLKNAAANVFRGGSAALVALLLPPFLTRWMSVDAFSTWTLVLQLSAYVGYLDFGIQTAVGRFIAHSQEKGDTGHRDRIVSTSFAALTIAGALGVAGSAAIAISWPHFFPHMPSSLVGQGRLAFFLMATSVSIGLPFSVFNGVFVGLQRNEVPASIIATSRIISAVCMVIVVQRNGDLISMSAAVGAINIGSYILQFVMYKRFCRGYKISRDLISTTTGRELFDHCMSLSVWSFAMLLITGLDLTLVGIFQFEAVAYYAVAASMVTFVIGLQNAVFSAIVSPVAILNVRGDSVRLGKLLIAATRYGTFLLLLTGLPLTLFARSVLDVWVGSGYGSAGARLLQILTVANIIRLSATPYAMSLVGTGQQRFVILTPIVEGVTNLVVSIAAGLVYGAMGVAIGTLIGATVGVMLHISYNMPRTTALQFHISSYIRDGLLRPLVCALPLVAYCVIAQYAQLSMPLSPYLALSVAVAITATLIWKYGMVGWERDRLRLGRWLPRT